MSRKRSTSFCLVCCVVCCVLTHCSLLMRQKEKQDERYREKILGVRDFGRDYMWGLCEHETSQKNKELEPNVLLEYIFNPGQSNCFGTTVSSIFFMWMGPQSHRPMFGCCTGPHLVAVKTVMLHQYPIQWLSVCSMQVDSQDAAELCPLHAHVGYKSPSHPDLAVQRPALLPCNRALDISCSVDNPCVWEPLNHIMRQSIMSRTINTPCVWESLNHFRDFCHPEMDQAPVKSVTPHQGPLCVWTTQPIYETVMSGLSCATKIPCVL